MGAQPDRPPVPWLRARYERQIRFLVRRFDPGAALGLSLTASLAAVVVAGWAFGIVVQDVIVGDGSIRFDRPVLGWVARHREPWLTVVMKTVTELGSSLVLVPLIGAVAAWFWWRHKTARPAPLLGAAYGGGGLLSPAGQDLTARPPPPRTPAPADREPHAL